MDRDKRPTLSLKPTGRKNPRPSTDPTPSHLQPTREFDCLEVPPRPLPRRPLFGEWLVRHGVLRRDQLLRALATAHLHDWRIGDAVVVLRLAPRARVEAEAELFLAHHSPPVAAATRTLERRARRLQRAALRSQARP